MATISTLHVNLSARTALFNKRMKAAGRRVRTFSVAVSAAGRRVLGMGAAMASVAAAGVVAYVGRSMKAIDATKKMADVLGLTTDELIGYQLAAKLAGVENKELETGLRRLQKNVSDATVGLTTAQRAFTALGLDARELQRVSPDKQFKIVADALGRVTEQTTKVRVAQDLFGRSGVKLIKLSELGAAGLSNIQAEARKLGITYNDIDARKVEAANDALGRMILAFEGLANTLAINAAPEIKRIADEITELVSSGGAEEFFRQWGQGIKEQFPLTLRLVRLATDLFHGPAVEGPNGRLMEETQRRFREMQEAKKAAKPGSSPIDLGEIEKRNQAAADAAMAQERLAREAERWVERTRTPLEQYESTVGDLNNLLEQGAVDWQTYGRAVRMARAELEDASRKTDDLVGNADDLNQSLERMNRGATRELGRFVSLDAGNAVDAARRNALASGKVRAPDGMDGGQSLAMARNEFGANLQTQSQLSALGPEGSNLVEAVRDLVGAMRGEPASEFTRPARGE